MKQLAFSAAISVLVSLSCIVLLQFTSSEKWSDISVSRIDELEARLRKSSESIAALRLEIHTIQEQLVRLGNVSNPGESAQIEEHTAALAERVRVLEKTLESLPSPTTKPKNKVIESVDNEIAKSLKEPTEVTPYYQNAAADIDFENDSGIPLGDYADSLSESLHAVDGIYVSDMDCRKTICKITYSKTEPLVPEEGDESEWQLMDKLTSGLEGRALDIRYSNDAQGNQVMYVQIQ